MEKLSSYENTFSVLRENAIYSANYTPTFKEKHCLLLSKNLHFYELNTSKIVFAIDLSGTILKGSTIPNTNDLRCPKVPEGYGVKTGPSSSEDIEFGKFVHFEGSATKRIFFLIKVSDKLILLERCFNGLKIVKQLDNVLQFSIVDPDNSFFPIVHIICKDSTNKGIYFGKNHNNHEDGFPTTSTLQKNAVVKSLLDKMKNSKTELAIQKTITKKEYFFLKTQLTFGTNFIRGSDTAEKQILQKCGDIWMRIHNSKLVIGIPVINNSNERFIPLQNIRTTLYCAEHEITEFDYNIYHLKNAPFMHSKSTKSSEQEHREDNYDWFSKECRIIQPTCSAVIVLQIDHDALMTAQSRNFFCLILYDIVIKDKKFQQQCPVHDIIIEDDFLYNSNYHLKFEPKTLLQDLLVVTSTSFSKYFRIEFDLERISLKNILTEKLGYKSFESTEETTELIDIDELASFERHYSVKTLCDHILLNKDHSSPFYGSLLIVCNCFDVAALKIYTRTELKLYALMRDIYNLLPAECKILPTTCTSMQSKVQLLKFKEALWNNIMIVEKFCHQNKKRLKRSATLEFQQSKLVQDLKTDIIALKTL